MMRKLFLFLVGLGLFSGRGHAAEELIEVRMPTRAAGSTTLINSIIEEKGFDEKNGVDIEYTLRAGIPSYWSRSSSKTTSISSSRS